MTSDKIPRVEDQPLTRLLPTQDYTPQKKIVTRLFSACAYKICNYFYTALSYCYAGMTGSYMPHFSRFHSARLAVTLCRAPMHRATRSAAVVQRCVPLPQLSFCEKPNCSKLCQV
jgi:hypothetical protein